MAVRCGSLGLVLGLLPGFLFGQTAERIDFAREIRPLLSDKCFFCHGPDDKHREADLRLDRPDQVFKVDAPLVVPGNPDQSPVWQRLHSADPETVMPPPDSGKSLTPQQRAKIRAWIEQGAEWTDHWAWTRLRRPPVPDAKGTWHRGPIDCFVLDRLVREGLRPSPTADPEILVRRLHFDLTGLPPSGAVVAEFLADADVDIDQAADRLIDRLMSSPAFGERLAAVWLDLVRYADTVGYHGDQEHHISPYRDYVIQAWNANMPFDQFTREQLAGDLLPKPTTEQLIATGYNRLLQTSHEGGVQQREYLAKYSADRVRNFGTVWLGVTLQCSECHDHKFDPLPQRDFYRLAACFADIDDLRSFKGADANPTKREPEMDVTTALVPGESRRTMVTVAIAPRPIRVLSRGDWLDDTGEIVEPGVPSLFAQAPSAGRMTRLDLASWLTGTENPLVARVLVNRLWKLFYGRGLASRLDDFGAQGEPPSHPELLDWLAVDLRESGWNVKQTIRHMVLARAYRQSSLEPPELRSRDPENRFLARQSRSRIDAEMVRDNVLVVSGLLSDRLGGRSVRPYQPEGYYDFLNFPKRGYKADTGDAQYRRAVYIHWQRAYLHPMLKAFDAPSREECTCERLPSNTPMSALVLLNDPTFVEAARVFAQRILHEGGSETGERLDWAWNQALSRRPTPRERATVLAVIERERVTFSSAPEAARALIQSGQSPVDSTLSPVELATWTSVARVLFNLNEFTMRN